VYQVYFVKSVYHSTRRVKIGFTKDIEQRMRALKTSCPGEMHLMGSIKCKSEYSARALEKSLHEMFARYRTAGEWFHVKGILMDFIAAAVSLDEDALEEVLRTAKYRMGRANDASQRSAEAKAKYGGEWLRPRTQVKSKSLAEKGSVEYYKNVLSALQTEFLRVREEMLDLRAENSALKSRLGIVQTSEKKQPLAPGAVGGGSGVVVPVPLSRNQSTTDVVGMEGAA
jgi:hypothetical protein